ncbi:unnamed protein product [Clavelina lepadiformis]|uniref:Signal peptide peptidase n=1 Tax=Clavelina lepadiformis TaxID=159417 RepID=A0ABP0GF63_CLALP
MDTEEIGNTLKDLVNETLESNNVSTKVEASLEGQAVTFSSLIIMAVVPIIIGSYRSLNQHESGETPETITKHDALKFPLVASGVLFGIYMFFKIFSQEYITMLIGFYFFVLGIFAVNQIASPYITKMIPSFFPNKACHLVLTEGSKEEKEVILDLEFDRKDVVAFGLCTVLSGWYALQRHWIANNIIGLAFATNGVELLRLNSISTGCILLIGLFFYDVFWVFGTNVMITVAKNFNAPIKVVFPQDFLVNGIFGTNFSMLGLGDIVIPGIFIALLLRFDRSLQRDRKTYFYTGLIAYFIGLVTTIVVMVVFKHPQPALLYLVPACLGAPLGAAFINGDLQCMFKYSDEKSIEQPDAKDNTADTEKKAQ